ncbi:MAG TPA: HNH endonuclease signature motif containing protein, partial [Streptosporangiaceae bacterium]|nr:HNH endonuclease signature motif containing protein [Streptosporangiaceae bacterium]
IERNKAAARELLLRHAIALLSGPTGLASWLRTGTLPPPAGSVSLPLDVGKVTELVPPHLRRAIIRRDRHCAAPGCDTPPAGCQVHHIIPRSKGGTTSLGNCILLCSFHHLILIHRWGWAITLNADGTTTARSPDGRTLHSHSPPAAA